jgi:hypothetical protein
VHRLVKAWLAALLLAGCAPKRAEPAAPPPAAPIATKLVVPDAGPFDFSKPPREDQPFVSGDLDHPGSLAPSPALGPVAPR